MRLDRRRALGLSALGVCIVMLTPINVVYSTPDTVGVPADDATLASIRGLQTLQNKVCQGTQNPCTVGIIACSVKTCGTQKKCASGINVDQNGKCVSFDVKCTTATITGPNHRECVDGDVTCTLIAKECSTTSKKCEGTVNPPNCACTGVVVARWAIGTLNWC